LFFNYLFFIVLGINPPIDDLEIGESVSSENQRKKEDFTSIRLSEPFNQLVLTYTTPEDRTSKKYKFVD